MESSLRLISKSSLELTFDMSVPLMIISPEVAV